MLKRKLILMALLLTISGTTCAYAQGTGDMPENAEIQAAEETSEGPAGEAPAGTASGEDLNGPDGGDGAAEDAGDGETGETDTSEEAFPENTADMTGGDSAGVPEDAPAAGMPAEEIQEEEASVQELDGMPAAKAGWYRDGAGRTYYYGSDGSVLTGWQAIDGRGFCFTDDGHLMTGWNVINGFTYYMGSDGGIRTGFQTIGGKKYYFQPSTTEKYYRGTMAKGWRSIGGKTCYFGDDGIMRTNWQTINGFRYYFGTDGAERTGWQSIGGKKFYFFKSTLPQYKNHYKGTAAKGINKIDGARYYFDSYGILQTGWKTISGKRYYFGDTGRLLNGIQDIDGHTYILKDSCVQEGFVTYKGKIYIAKAKIAYGSGWIEPKGAYQRGELVTESGLVSIYNSKFYINKDYSVHTGWKTVNGNTYYFHPERIGSMTGKAASYETSLNGFDYYFDPSTRIMATGLKNFAGKWYYYWPETKNGHYRGTLAKNTWLTLSGKKYHANRKGAFDQGFVKDSGGWRYFGSDGAMRTSGWQYLYRNEAGKKICSRWYYFNSSGYAVTGKKTIRGKTYTFDSDGVLKGYDTYDSGNQAMKKGAAESIRKNTSDCGYIICDSIRYSAALRKRNAKESEQQITDAKGAAAWVEMGKGKIFIADHNYHMVFFKDFRVGDKVQIINGNRTDVYKVTAKGFGKNKMQDLVDMNGSSISGRLNSSRICIYTCTDDLDLLLQGKEIRWVICQKQ